MYRVISPTNVLLPSRTKKCIARIDGANGFLK